MILAASILGVCIGAALGYLIGYRAGDLRGRPSWDEKNAAELAAWHDGVRFGQHLERNKAELGL